MFLFIGESLGMQELILIGVIALIVFGPRKLPEMARTIGKFMAEFRKATNDFKETWEKEVNFEEFREEKQIKSISSTTNTISQNPVITHSTVSAPEIKEIKGFELENTQSSTPAVNVSEKQADKSINGKQDWL